MRRILPNKYTQYIFIIFPVLLMIFSYVFQAIAADTAGVSATVTVQNISLTVSDGSIAYGTLPVMTNSSTALADGDSLDDTQVATNNGNVTEDLNIIGVDSANWELGSTTAPDQYTHKFCISDCDGTPTWTEFNEDSYTSITTGVAASGTQPVDLQIGTPSTTTNYTQQTVSVTVQAVAN